MTTLQAWNLPSIHQYQLKKVAALNRIAMTLVEKLIYSSFKVRASQVASITPVRVVGPQLPLPQFRLKALENQYLSDHDDTVSHQEYGPDKLDSRFIGDLNPEGLFRAATSPHTTRDASLNGSIGVWLAEKLRNEPSLSESQSPRQEIGPSFLYGFSALIRRSWFRRWKRSV